MSEERTEQEEYKAGEADVVVESDSKDVVEEVDSKPTRAPRNRSCNKCKTIQNIILTALDEMGKPVSGEPGGTADARKRLESGLKELYDIDLS